MHGNTVLEMNQDYLYVLKSRLSAITKVASTTLFGLAWAPVMQNLLSIMVGVPTRNSIFSSSTWTVMTPHLVSLLRWNIQLWSSWINLSLQTMETGLFKLSEYSHSRLGACPCRVFLPRESAIIIVGAGDGELPLTTPPRCGVNFTLRVKGSVETLQ